MKIKFPLKDLAEFLSRMGSDEKKELKQLRPDWFSEKVNRKNKKFNIRVIGEVVSTPALNRALAMLVDDHLAEKERLEKEKSS